MSQEPRADHDKGILDKVKDALGMNGEPDPGDMPSGGDDAHLTEERRESEREQVAVGSRPPETGYTAESSYDAPAPTDRDAADRDTTDRETQAGRS